MSAFTSELERISAEFRRRARVLPPDRYWLNKPANMFLRDQTVRACVRMLDRAGLFPPHNIRVLDVGCGMGGWLLEFMLWGADQRLLSGIDLDSERVQRARARLPHAELYDGAASGLPWPDQSFDLVTQFTVFTSILDAGLKRAVAREMLRVLKPGGVVLWFDFHVNNPRNPHVRGVRRAEIRRLFPGCELILERALLAPPLARLLAPRAWWAAELLHAVSWLRTHYIGLIRKPS
jgi:SAM-dependent methyltransferase